MQGTGCYTESYLLVSKHAQQPTALIDDLDDLVRSGIPLALPVNTLLPKLVSYDPRESARKLSYNMVPYNFSVPLPKWLQEG